MRRFPLAGLLGVLALTTAASLPAQSPPAAAGKGPDPVPSPFRAYIAADGRVTRSNLAEVQVKDLEKFPNNTTLNLADLRAGKLVDPEKPYDGLRIRGDGPITKKLIVEADYFDFGAEAAIRANGGSCLISPGSRNRQDKMHCLVCENGLAPVIAIFSKSVPKDASDPLAKLLKELQKLIETNRGDRFASFVIFLRSEPGEKEVLAKDADGKENKLLLEKEFIDDDRTKEVPGSKPSKFIFDRETELTAVRGDTLANVTGFASAAETPEVPFGIAASTSKLAKAYGIPEDAETLTVVLYNRLFVVKPWTFKAGELTDEKIQEIVTAAKDTIKGLGN